ncbi:MAG: tetratricopeptide repeat protein [Bradymonadaceae bacterium]|nr:tetratricopeptide repeat protein [Lujinxingiaceae bacterium]
MRKASFRPPEELAVRRDVLEAFRAACISDAAHVVDTADVQRRALLGGVFAEEALGRYDAALQTFGRLQKLGPISSIERTAARRLFRATGDSELVMESLEAHFEHTGADQERLRSLLALERAGVAWQQGMAARQTLRWVESALESGSVLDEFPVYSALWATQLQLDALLETGRLDEALAWLVRAGEHVGLDAQTRRHLTAQRAVWLNACGQPDEALSIFSQLAQDDCLPGDLEEGLLALLYEKGERDQAFGLLRRSGRPATRLGAPALALAMFHETASANPATSRELLKSASEAAVEDWTLLRVREGLLEREALRGTPTAGAELIDIINRRLEGPLSSDERIYLLTRLGRLYEVEADLEQAAAEVYREALSYSPNHVPALRALGRIYTGRGNWRGLVDLYEREIAALGSAQSGWRRHFQVAEIYETHLQNPERALEHHLKVLALKTNYLPALKCAARLLSTMERWAQLADLFLGLVEDAPTRRQKLYLLDKVAEVAELRLNNVDVAVGAWLEILDIEPENPRAFTALGRLYARSERWEELIALNLSEGALIDDPEEMAATHVRNAEIAEQHLGDAGRAEDFYRQALDVAADFLPALEGLGRIYMRGGRWAEIVHMTGRELRSRENDPDVMRQLGALAELFETRLERRQDAITLYEEILARDPSDAYVFSTLLRLYEGEENWARVAELLQHRLRTPLVAAERAALLGELARLQEWRLSAPASAYAFYMAALEADPQNLHWLDGIVRTWVEADQAPDVLADALEDLLLKPTDGSTRDVYFAVIARLRERAESCPEASRAYRACGNADSLENQIVLRLAMARAHERDALARSRRCTPHFELEALINLERRDLDAQGASMLRQSLPALECHEQQWMLGEFELSASAQFLGNGCDPVALLGRDMVEILEGNLLRFDEPGDIESMSSRQRLRALEARIAGDFHAYSRWTRAEMAVVNSAELSVHRLLEMAKFAVASSAPIAIDALFGEAAAHAFNELDGFVDDGSREMADAAALQLDIEAAVAEKKERAVADQVDGPTLDYLYDSLVEAEQWQMLRRCLEAHVSRSGLGISRRLYLFQMLARVLEQNLGEVSGALTALSQCWQLSEDPKFLRDLVRLSVKGDDLARAIRFQQTHFERITGSGQTSVSEKLQSGLWLSELLLDDPERLDDALACMEHLIVAYPGDALTALITRKLAHAHVRAGGAHRAVELFQGVLKFSVLASEVDDWRTLIDVYWQSLRDVATAYRLQWKVVRAFPESTHDLDNLIDLAMAADELEDCVEQLEELAKTQTGNSRVALLARAAEAVDEDLKWYEEAARLYNELMTLTRDNHGTWLYFARRRAFCLGHIAGREDEALVEFRTLVSREAFEPSTYRGLITLFERTQAHDRLRVARQTLLTLGCDVEDTHARGKNRPSRPLDRPTIETYLLPDALRAGVIDVLKAVSPLAEKLWFDALPQRKALEGSRHRRVEGDKLMDAFDCAFDAFGIKRFKLQLGDSGPASPQVFPDTTPFVWLNSDFVAKLTEPEQRFVAGYCAAIAWSDLPALLTLDGRQLWHLVEGVLLRHSGKGFTERVDVVSQELAEQVSSPFFSGARRRVVQCLDGLSDHLADAHCEAWPEAILEFAHRAGLVMCGDVTAAARCILRMEGWDLELVEPATQKRLRHNRSVEALFNFAMSDSYLDARFTLGLAGRPSVLNI